MRVVIAARTSSSYLFPHTEANDASGAGAPRSATLKNRRGANILADCRDQHLVGFASNSFSVDLKGAKVGATSRTGGPCWSGWPGWSGRPDLPTRSCRSRGASFTHASLFADCASCSGLAGCTLFTRGSGRAYFAALALRPRGALQTRFALGPAGPWGPAGPCAPAEPGGPDTP